MLEIDKIYEQYQKTVYKYLMCLTKNSDIAEELTQETFYKMIRKINTYKGQSNISVWLCEIAKNLWYDELRKNKRKIISSEETEEIISNENIEEDYISKENVLKIRKRIDKLDELTKRVLYLRLNSDLSFKEIGEILGKSETWARVTFYRGKQKVKEGEFYEE